MDFPEQTAAATVSAGATEASEEPKVTLEKPKPLASGALAGPSTSESTSSSSPKLFSTPFAPPPRESTAPGGGLFQFGLNSSSSAGGSIFASTSSSISGSLFGTTAPSSFVITGSSAS